jgi:hypothetical protein
LFFLICQIGEIRRHDDGQFDFIMAIDSFRNEDRRFCFLDDLSGFACFRDISRRCYNRGPWFEKVKWFLGSLIAEFGDMIPSESTQIRIEKEINLKIQDHCKGDLRVISADCNDISARLPVDLWVEHFWW